MTYDLLFRVAIERMQEETEFPSNIEICRDGAKIPKSVYALRFTEKELSSCSFENRRPACGEKAKINQLFLTSNSWSRGWKFHFRFSAARNSWCVIYRVIHATLLPRALRCLFLHFRIDVYQTLRFRSLPFVPASMEIIFPLPENMYPYSSCNQMFLRNRESIRESVRNFVFIGFY